VVTAPDPRPLPGEPLSLDLLNTRWNSGGNPRDLLDSTAGLASWLARWPDLADARADEATRRALRHTRDVLRQLVAAPDDAGRAALNTVLGHGRLRLVLTPDGPAERVEIDDPAWSPAWAAARDLLRLLADRPDRLRACAGPGCVLHFYDTSKNGSRRWCSMTTCGNRTKAARHYARHHPG
jgi:predicted RNA-binding Zn ribbon-like protein